MKSKYLFVVLALFSVAFVPACDDTAAPPPPDALPQIKVNNTFNFNYRNTTSGLPDANVWDITVTSEGEVWIGTSLGVAVYASSSAKQSVVQYSPQNGLPNSKVRRIVEYNGKIYVATWGGGVGVFDMASDTWSKYTPSNSGLRDLLVSDIDTYNDNIYFAHNKGVSILQTASGNWAQYTKANGLLMPPADACEGCPLDELVNNLVVAQVDRGGVVATERWHSRAIEFGAQPTAIPYLGITVRRGSSNIYYTTVNSGLPSWSVTDIVYDDVNGLFYLGTKDRGIAEVDVNASTWKTYTAIDGLPSNVIYSITRVGDHIWAGTQNGIAALDSNGRWHAYSTGSGLPHNRARVVTSDGDPNHLWVGFVDGGAALINPASAQGL